MKVSIRKKSLAALVVLAAFTVACATTQIERARQVSVNVHTALAVVDDAEMAFSQSNALPAWNADPFSGDPRCTPPSTEPCRTRHQVFSEHMKTALKAGLALNQGVRLAPVAPEAKADLATVSSALESLTAVVAGVLPPNSTITVTLTAAKDAVLKILPLFLE